ncbi:ribbon-helix-helix protein, CopG family [Candidatus Undinarchaeota archaeon]
MMETLQIRLPSKQLREIDMLVKEGEYASRSEAIRTMLKEFEAMEETLEILQDKELMKDIKRGLREIREGKVISLEKIEEEFLK